MDEDAWTRIQREQEKMKERKYVRFMILKLDPAWRRLPEPEREKQKDETRTASRGSTPRSTRSSPSQ